MFHESVELLGWRASDGELGGAGREGGWREARAAARQAGPWMNRWSLCARRAEEELPSLPAGPGGEAFELLAPGEEEGLG